MLTWVLVTLAGLGLAYGAVFAFGAWRWSWATGDLVAQLNAGRAVLGTDRYQDAGLIGLPAPVQRYFRAVLTDGQPIVTAVTLTQSGLFNLRAPADQWTAFTATQRFTSKRPGFVWTATMMLFPGVPVRVVDAYVAGDGLLRPTILGLCSLGKLQGSGEIARGELLRHFSESVWFPTAFLPS